MACYAHNYQGYDNGAVLRALAQMDSTRQPSVINRTGERQICCTWEGLSFRDSMSLMSGSLGKLIESARGSLEGQALMDKFPLMAERHPYCGDADDLSLLLRKLPFPYSSLNSPACFDEDYPIPPKEAFADDLHDLPVDEGEWACPSCTTAT